MNRENPNFETKPESEREGRIKDIERQVDEIADKLGMPIDKEIKDAVVALNVWGIPTSQSCEGHLQEKGASFPWIEVYAPEPGGWEEGGEKEKEWIVENLKHRVKTMELLEEFYKDRETPFDAKLNFSNIGIYGGFRIQSMSVERMPIISDVEQKEKLLIYQKEMNDFAKFLKNKFLE
ncbi:MAG: hypothetical protein V1686_02380 [Patescibacteria group bacterium]